MAQNLNFGIDFSSLNDIDDALTIASTSSANFIVTPLFHPRNKRDSNTVCKNRTGPGTRSDRVLESKSWLNNVVGKISEWITFTSSDMKILNDNIYSFEQEMSWAKHLGLQAVVLPTPALLDPNYCKHILPYCQTTSYQQLWIRIPLQQILRHDNIDLSTSDTSNTSINRDITHHSNINDGWCTWNNFRTMTGNIHNISIALELTEDLFEDILVTYYHKWTSEPVKAIIIPTHLFTSNHAGYPVLSKAYQTLISYFLKFKIYIMFKGLPRITPQTIANIQGNAQDTLLSSSSSSFTSKHKEKQLNYIYYIQYITYLRDQVYESLTTYDKLFSTYSDRLQYPLQPLMDNLEAQVYEVFENDSMKYYQYERAIVTAIKALQSKLNICTLSDTYMQSMLDNKLSPSIHMNNVQDHNNNNTASSLSSTTSMETFTHDMTQTDSLSAIPRVLVVCVVGAGRGPLVSSAINASKETNQPILIYAIEKNDNAIITLRNRKLTENWTNVTIIHTDMRDWKPVDKIDIMISELLGSWGDNELSPECLYGIQHCLHPIHGISIPTSYISYLSPISASRLWTAVKALPATKDIQTYIDTPFVVRLHNYYQLAVSQSVFEFIHPDYSENIDNRRYKSISFISTSHTTLHGFCGTFLSYLYEHVTLSTVTENRTANMESWFPLFLPLCTPVEVHEKDIITIHIWRCVNARKVWYEWCLSSPQITPVQNSQGHSYWIGL